MTELRENPNAKHFTAAELDEILKERYAKHCSPVTTYTMTSEQLAELNARLVEKNKRPQILPPVESKKRGGRERMVDVDDNVKAESMTDEEIKALIEERGLHGLLSVSMVRQHPKELLKKMVEEEKLSARMIAEKRNIGSGTVGSLKKLYGLAEAAHGKKGIPVDNRSSEFVGELLEVERPILELNYEGKAGICHKMAAGIIEAIAILEDETELEILITVRRAG